MAAIPLIFATQQAIEGTLWLRLTEAGSATVNGPLVTFFAVCALVLWPMWSPLAVGLVEPKSGRRVLIAAIFVLAIPVSILGIQDVSTGVYGVCVIQHSLSYANGLVYSPLEIGAYIASTCVPFLLSSHSKLRICGAIIAMGLVVSGYFYLVTSFSVWCFFAAIGSVTLYWHFAALPKAFPLPKAI